MRKEDRTHNIINGNLGGKLFALIIVRSFTVYMDGPPLFFLSLHPYSILSELTASHYMLIARTGSYISTFNGEGHGWVVFKLSWCF